MNKNNGIKLTKQELLRMANDLNMDVNKLIKYLAILEDNKLTKLDKDNVRWWTTLAKCIWVVKIR